jgi:endothelin-converting enzyme/putative endopeptidase
VETGFANIDDRDVVPFDEAMAGTDQDVTQARGMKEMMAAIDSQATAAEEKLQATANDAMQGVIKPQDRTTLLGEDLPDEDTASDQMADLEKSLSNLKSMRNEADGMLNSAKDAVSSLTKVVSERSAEVASITAAGADGGKSLEGIANAMDKTADKCADFYQYACGGWVKSTKKPSDVASWTKTFSVISKRNKEAQKLMFMHNDTHVYKTINNEEVAMVKKYYASCMDKAGRSSRGLTDSNFTKWTQKIAAVTEKKDLMLLYADFTNAGIDIGPFEIGVGADEKDATTNVLGINQGGIGLPSRDYYGVGKKGDNDRFKQVRAAYVTLMQKSFAMVNVQAVPQAVLDFETELAKIMWTKTQMRDPHATYFPTTIGNFTKHHLAWEKFFGIVRQSFPAFTNASKIVLSPRPYFTALEKLLAKTDIAALRGHAYRRFLAKMMPATTVDAGELSFEFYGKVLNGVEERPVLWKRCVASTVESLWGMTDRMFVERNFHGKSKELANEMLDTIIKAFQDRLDKNSWMDAQTIAKAKKKLAAMGRKIGYPDEWRGYVGIEVGDSYLANMLSSFKVELDRNFNKMGQKVDKGTWSMNPSATNAYYSPSKNEMAFPAGILQPPFFNVDQPAVLNYGAIGAVMGHELVHGFDDQGAEFDANGDMKSWWSDASYDAFEAKAKCIAEQYPKIPLPELAQKAPALRIDGKLTLGENIADNGGVVTSLQAYEDWQKKKDTPTEYNLGGGVVPAKELFWLAYGQTWCRIGTPESLMVQIRSDPHSPARARVEGPLQNSAEFAATMKCTAGSTMNPQQKCLLW